MSFDERRTGILCRLCEARGFCDEAWKAIYQYVFALANGAEGWYSDDWIDPKHKGVAICSCNDGLRPVIIKVERVNE